jgi:hypothetical protein
MSASRITRTDVYRCGVSFNKIFDFMASRLPIAFACETFADPVTPRRCRHDPSDDPRALADAFSRSRLPAMSGSEGASRSTLRQAHDLDREAFADIVGCAAVDVPSPR